MEEIKIISREISNLNGKNTSEKGSLVGYGAIIDNYKLKIPKPNQLSMIGNKHIKYKNEDFQVFPLSYMPKDTLYDHIVFALKWEGVDLLLFKKLFEILSQKNIEHLISKEPQGKYSRKIWFLYEFLMEKTIPIDDLDKGNYVSIIDPKLQYSLENGQNLKRYRIINNLIGTKDYCPLVRKTEKLEEYIKSNLSLKNNNYLKGYSKDILLRTSAFLMLKDSKASFSLEGESPKSRRASGWANIIAQSGERDLSREEFIRLQDLVIENKRFIDVGYRKVGGFVGSHDSSTMEPIPDHISAKWQDIDKLIEGLLETYNLLMNDGIDAVISACSISFGFVFIHPFVDGNGRIHRYLIHHILSKKDFVAQGITFPISASMLENIHYYRKSLEAFSHPIIEFIDWKTTEDHNIDVINDTIDYYRYFDITKQVEFLYDSVKDTIDNVIPQEVDFLINYDRFKIYLDNAYEMPDKMVDLLVQFLRQNSGKLSKRAINKEFSDLTDIEIEDIETNYRSFFQ